MSGEALTYEPTTDTLLVEMRPWPGGGAAATVAGGEDAGEGLVIHYAPDGEPWAWEIEGASRRPELVGRALAAVRSARGLDRVA